MADVERSLPQFGGQRMALSFVPATPDDAEALASYLPAPHADGTPVQPEEFPQELPGYLIEMSTRLMVGDQALSGGGSASVTLGLPVLVQTEFYDPSQQAWAGATERVAEVGEYHAFTVNGQGVGLPRALAMAQRLDGLRRTLKQQKGDRLAKRGQIYLFFKPA
ncbi:hypothetical protein D0B54_21875 [Solimonas sp. K1W22B-7]|uniref:hypothetical protein n=1 Tax=Solimonas sp. K1W22B-7 TaxID=2303331 RepID=UPI000E330D49|nr:hypothetical protein [Solimonas sp. K1W22B-7]AXQ31162.1 hypothetical protein D0B54_21875 [Solimonas sp. K1W22B-7]